MLGKISETWYPWKNQIYIFLPVRLNIKPSCQKKYLVSSRTILSNVVFDIQSSIKYSVKRFHEFFPYIKVNYVSTSWLTKLKVVLPFYK